MSCGMNRKQLGSCVVAAVLWCRLAAVAVIQPLAWELPYALGAPLKRRKKERKNVSSARQHWPTKDSGPVLHQEVTLGGLVFQLEK